MDICPPELSDATSSTSSASSAPSTPSPELSSNARDVFDDDCLPVDPEFVAALEQLELVPEKVTQFDEQDEVYTATLALLELSKG